MTIKDFEKLKEDDKIYVVNRFSDNPHSHRIVENHIVYIENGYVYLSEYNDNDWISEYSFDEKINALVECNVVGIKDVAFITMDEALKYKEREILKKWWRNSISRYYCPYSLEQLKAVKNILEKAEFQRLRL